MYKNNPFNIRYNPKNEWIGSNSQKNGFCEFSTRDFGIRAALITLRTYLCKGYTTVDTIISRWAPVTDSNFTSHYAMWVSKYLKDGISTKIEFGSDNFFEMVCRMAWFESNAFLTPIELKYIIKKFEL